MAKWSSAKYKEHFQKLLSVYQTVFNKLVATYDGITISFSYSVSDNVKPKEKS